MGEITRSDIIDDFVDAEVLTHTDLNTFIDNIITAINDCDNDKFSDDTADRLASSKVSNTSGATTTALHTFLNAEHGATGAHTAYASNKVDRCRFILNSGAPTTSVDIDADQINLYSSDTIATRVRLLVQSVNVTASIASSGANGLDTGAEAGSTWYYAWVIAKSSDSTTASLLSTGSTISTISLPTGYDRAACVGKVYNNADSDFEYVQPMAGVSEQTDGTVPAVGRETDYAATTTNCSVAGWTQLGSGLWVQWGLSDSIAATSTLALVFEKPFPTAAYAAFTANTANANLAVAVTALSTTGLTLSNGTAGAVFAYWMAIGN